MFREIRNLLKKCTDKDDDKLHNLRKLLDKNSGEKILVFSEFSATIKYLYESVTKWKGKKERVYAELNNAMKAAQRFDPENNPRSSSDEKIPNS